MNEITHFAYEYDYLSNFYTATVEFGGDKFLSVEHAYQAAKTAWVAKRQIFTLDFNPNLTAAQAKKLGQKIELREDWKKLKVPIMRDLLLQKFADPALKAKLLKTGDSYLEEGNHWHDVFWGVCHHKLEGKTCKEPEHRPFGGNHLGFLLMDVRSHYEAFRRTFFVL
jgi:ribA/ribD-fused uncharacterized protein